METSGNERIERYISERNVHAKFIRKHILEMLLPFVYSWSEQISNLELILNNIRDGLIVIDDEAKINLMNKAAKEIIGY